MKALPLIAGLAISFNSAAAIVDDQSSNGTLCDHLDYEMYIAIDETGTDVTMYSEHRVTFSGGTFDPLPNFDATSRVYWIVDDVVQQVLTNGSDEFSYGFWRDIDIVEDIATLLSNGTTEECEFVAEFEISGSNPSSGLDAGCGPFGDRDSFLVRYRKDC